MRLTKEQTEAKTKELLEFIEENKNIPGPLMPVMQKAQDLFGYLSLDTQTVISEALDIPVSEIYGVATFYSQFSLEPKGDRIVSICTGTACYVKGSQPLLEEVERQLGVKCGQTSADGKFTVEATRCLGCCGLAPVLVIGDDVYGRLSPKDVKDILAKY